MTPREANLAVEGWRLQEHAEWQRALRQTQVWGDKATADDFVPLNGQSSSKARRPSQMTEERWRGVLWRMGYDDKAEA